MASQPPIIGIMRNRRDIDNLETAFDRMDHEQNIPYLPRTSAQRAKRENVITQVKDVVDEWAVSFIQKYPDENDVGPGGVRKNDQGADHILEQLQRREYILLANLLPTDKPAVIRPFAKTLASFYLNPAVNKYRKILRTKLCDSCKTCSCRQSIVTRSSDNDAGEVESPDNQDM